MPIGRPAFAAGPEPPGISLDDLHATLRFANRIFRTVNESNFVLLLTEGASSGPLGRSPAGLRACTFMLLCMSSKLHGEDAPAHAMFDRAMGCLDEALSEPPNELIISTLLLSVMMATLLNHGSNEALVRAPSQTA